MAHQEESCPKVKKLDDDLLNLSYEDRLKMFEEEATTLYAFCLKKGFSTKQLDQSVSGLHGPVKSITAQTLHDSSRSFLYLAIFIAFVSMIYASPKASNIVSAHYSLFTIKVLLPYWNYGQLWSEDCLIYNPWIKEEGNEVMDAKACKFCSRMVELNNNKIDRAKNVSKADIQKYYVSHNQPIIIDSMVNWDLEALSMEKIAELYQTNPYLTSSMGSCAYETNVGFNDTFYDFISAYVDKKLPSKWHAKWDNCDPKAAKIFRKYYSRLYFIPDMAQSSSTNSLIAAKGSQSEKFDFYGDTEQGRWLVVISGSIKGYLSPLEECLDNFGCAVSEFTLDAGESLFFFPPKWNFSYEVTGEEMTLVVSSSLIWDVE